jgi:hypothetical protein
MNSSVSYVGAAQHVLNTVLRHTTTSSIYRAQCRTSKECLRDTVLIGDVLGKQNLIEMATRFAALT